MDSYEASNMVFAKIQGLDPENASKIMGFILIQDPGEKEMIRLALGPDTLLQSLILQAKSYLGISSNSFSSSPSSPIPFNPISRPSFINNKNPFSHSSVSPRNPNPSSSPWLRNTNNSPNLISPSYAAVVNSGNTVNSVNNGGAGSSSMSIASPVSNQSNNVGDFEEFNHLSFLNDSKTDDLFDPRHESMHRRSVSFNDAMYGEDLGLGAYRPCMYFTRGHCKNGSTCNFRHNGGFGDDSDVDLPGKLEDFEQNHEILRSRAAIVAAQQQQQQQRIAVASQLMAGGSFPYNKCMNFFNDSPRSAAAGALMTGDEFHKFGRSNSDFSGMGLGGVNPGSRQIYLTFPADSTFREEDVSNYFSIYGPVQDVRIPYQQKRMFGFVTFVYPETVKLILAKGNPHFVCDSRVLVKPYKEKGKVDKKQYQQQQQQFERGELLGCPSPRETFDINIGPRMFYNAQELMLRRKLEEQADMQQAIEIHGRRMMNLQLLDIKNHQNHHQYQQNLSPVDPSALQGFSSTHITPNFMPSERANVEVPEDDNTASDVVTSPNASAHQHVELEVKTANNENTSSENDEAKEELSNLSDFELNESSIEKILLPDSLFASPTKSAGQIAKHSQQGGIDPDLIDLSREAYVEIEEKSEILLAVQATNNT